MFLEFFVDWLEKVSCFHWAMGSVHKIEIKEQFIRSLFTGQDNETIGFFGNKRWISRKGEIINHGKEAFKNFFTITSEDKHLDF